MPWDSFLLDWDDDLTARGFAALGALVRRRRRQLRITQRELEWLSGIDQTLISKLENGRLKGMRWSRFGRLVGALGGLAEDDPEPEWRQRGGRSGIEGARWRPRAISLEADDEDDEDDEDGEDDETDEADEADETDEADKADKADKADTEGARTRMIHRPHVITPPSDSSLPVDAAEVHTVFGTHPAWKSCIRPEGDGRRAPGAGCADARRAGPGGGRRTG